MTNWVSEQTTADVLYGALWRWRLTKKRVNGRIVELAWRSTKAWSIYLDVADDEIAVEWKGRERKIYDHWPTTPGTVLAELADRGVPVEMPVGV